MRKLAVLPLLALCAHAQWLDYHDPRTPRSTDGKPNLSAPAPRTNGKPDLSGLWEIDQTPFSELRKVLPPEFFELQIDLGTASAKYMINLLWDFKPEDDPSRPEAVALVKERQETGGEIFPSPGASPTAFRLP